MQDALVHSVLNRCRWSKIPEEQLLYIKYNDNKLNILDIQKEKLILKAPILLEKSDGSNLQNLSLLFQFILLLLNRLIKFFLNYLTSYFLALNPTYSIDLCDAKTDLLATAGASKEIRIYDKRDPSVVKTFENIDTSNKI